MRIYKSDSNALLVILILVICVYVLIFFSCLNRPLQSDDFRNASQLKMPYSDYYNPPLYIIILKFLSKYLGLVGKSLRLFNFFCFFVNIALVYFLTKQLSKNKQAALLGSILFTISPLAIQGTFIFDVDLTILPPLLTLFALSFSHCCDNLNLKNCFLLGCLFFFCLFAKFSTPLALPPAVLIFFWLRRKALFGLSRALLISLFGLGLFCLIWAGFAYYHQLPFRHFFRGTSVSLWFNRYLYFSLIEYAKYLIRIAVWGGPILLLIVLACASRIKDFLYRRNIRPLDFCLLCIGGIFLGYFFTGRASHRFLKYLYPALPFTAIVIANFIGNLKFQFNKQTSITLACFLPIIFIYNTFVSGDLIYTLEHTIRQVLVFAPANLKFALFNFSLDLLSYPLFILLLYFSLKFLNKRENLFKIFSLSILVVGICAQLSLNLLQAKADYTTNYYYGRDIKQMRELGELFKTLRERYPEGIIIGPGDVFADIDIADQEQDRAIGYDSDDPVAFAQLIEREEVVCVAYGISWNKISTFKKVIFNEQVQRALRDNYRLRKFGAFSAWLRK